MLQPGISYHPRATPWVATNNNARVLKERA